MTNEVAKQTKRDITTDTNLWTFQDVKKFFDPDNLLTEKQVGQALSLIKGRNLNPFANEVYIIAYRKKSGSVDFSLIVSKEAFLKRASLSPNYKGFESGIVVIDKDGEMIERKGMLKLPTDTLIGGWARVYRKDFDMPIEIFVGMDEYDKKKSTWLSMPATMIRKTALVNALREAFPDDLGNMYTEYDGGQTFDHAKDVTPQETQEEVRERKMKEIELFNQQQAQAKQGKTQTSYPAEEVLSFEDESIQVDSLEY